MEYVVISLVIILLVNFAIGAWQASTHARWDNRSRSVVVEKKPTKEIKPNKISQKPTQANNNKQKGTKNNTNNKQVNKKQNGKF